jgi:hypothetical protein
MQWPGRRDLLNPRGPGTQRSHAGKASARPKRSADTARTPSYRLPAQLATIERLHPIGVRLPRYKSWCSSERRRRINENEQFQRNRLIFKVKWPPRKKVLLKTNHLLAETVPGLELGGDMLVTVRKNHAACRNTKIHAKRLLKQLSINRMSLGRLFIVSPCRSTPDPRSRQFGEYNWIAPDKSASRRLGYQDPTFR